MKKTASAKGASAKRKAATKRAVERKAAPKPAPRKRKPMAKRTAKKKPALRMVRPVSTADWPEALQPVEELHADVRGGRPEAPDATRRPTVRGLLHPVTRPVDPHPGQTSEEGATHDRPGSQPERVRHLYPNGNRPNSGSARSAQYKGKRRDR